MKRIDGFIGIDIKPYNETDNVCDLTKGIPYNNESVDEVYSAHFLEHLIEDEFKFLIDEIWRVCKVGGKIDIYIPLLFPDPAHKIIFGYDWIKYWSLDKFRIIFYEIKVINTTTSDSPHKPFSYKEAHLILEKIWQGKNDDWDLWEIK